MYHLRISKYDIKYRNELGHFMGDDWTAICDIGQSFNGVVLTEAMYLQAENRYLNTIRETAKRLGVNYFNLKMLDIYDLNPNAFDFPLTEMATVSVEQAIILARLMLREEMWTILVHPDLRIEFSYDYYMCFVMTSENQEIKEIVKHNNLFWEEKALLIYEEGEEEEMYQQFLANQAKKTQSNED